MIIQKRKNGFTLIEILVVIGIISILASVVIVAVNPARQFKQARDSQRMANINAILNAVGQNISEHKGTFTCGGLSQAIPIGPVRISSASTEGGNIAGCLVPDYLASMPYDPSVLGASFTSNSNYDTGYFLSLDSGTGRVTISSESELAGRISVTR